MKIAMRTITVVLFGLFLLFASRLANAYQYPTHTQNISYGFNSTQGASQYNHDMHLNWHKEPVEGWGMYAMYYFSFQASIGGYTGLQKTTDPTRPKTAIFSIWDAQGKQTALPVAGTACVRFGHEGAGTSCIIPFNWKADTEYKMRVWRILNSATATSERWGAWVINVKTGEETLIGIIELLNTNGYVGYGMLNYQGISTVTEYFAGPANAQCSDVPDFSVTWKGPFANNGSINPTYAIGGYNTGIGSVCSQNNFTSHNVFSVTQENGPTVKRETSDGKYLWSQYNVSKMNKIDCVFNWIETRYGDTLKQPRLKRLSQSQFNQYFRDYRIEGKGSVIVVDTITDKVFKYDSGGINTLIGDLTEAQAAASCVN
jgi:Domain of unknown function (DUF3472)